MSHAGVRYADMVRQVMHDYKVSERTAKRRIKAVRDKLAGAV